MTRQHKPGLHDFDGGEGLGPAGQDRLRRLDLYDRIIGLAIIAGAVAVLVWW